MKIPPASQDFYGKTVGNMVSNLSVSESGSVSGTMHYVTGYTGFNETDASEQEGYFFPFTLVKNGTKMTFVKNGIVTKKDIPWDAHNVFLVTRNDKFAVRVDGADVMTFSFTEAIFEAKIAKAKLSPLHNKTEISHMSVADLKGLAAEIGVEVTGKSTGADLKKAIIEKLGL